MVASIRPKSWVFERHSSAGQIVLDTHLGSGSSRIAAHKTGLAFVGFEVEADYLSAFNLDTMRIWRKYHWIGFDDLILVDLTI
jgi:DNA methylase